MSLILLIEWSFPHFLLLFRTLSFLVKNPRFFTKESWCSFVECPSFCIFLMTSFKVPLCCAIGVLEALLLLRWHLQVCLPEVLSCFK